MPQTAQLPGDCSYQNAATAVIERARVSAVGGRIRRALMLRDANGRMLTEGRRLLVVAVDDDNGVEVAKLVGVDPSMVYHLCAGRYRPSLTLAIVMRDALGIPVEAWVKPPGA
jgi:hypothetical protein